MLENRIIQQRVFNFENHKHIIGACAGERYVYDEETKAIITKLINYFNGLEIDGLSTTKGLMIIGEIGSGKTTLMEIFKNYLHFTTSPNKFNIVESRDICKEFAKSGFTGIEKYTFNPLPNNSGVSVSNPTNICIDDFGIESEYSKYYGTETNPVAEVLLDRYKIMKQYQKATHIVTNLSIESMKKKYPDRIMDRFKEMFNIIILESKSKRK